MGRFTPVTISTWGERKGRLTLVGVPPNMSVRISDCSPPTCSSARAIASRAALTSSLQPMETAAMRGMSPTMVRAALTSSPASAPCVTTTIPIMPASLPQVPVADADRVALAAERLRQRVGDHHRPVPPARAADGDRQVALALLDVPGHHEGEEALHLVEEHRRVLLAAHVADHGRVVAGERLQGGD